MLFLKESAIDWYDTLSRNVKTDLKSLLDNFKAYFGKSPLEYVFEEESIFTRAQHHKEKVQDYIAHMQKLAKRTPTLDDDLLLWVILKGLHPQIKASMIHQKAEIKSVADIHELAKITESAGFVKADESIDDSCMNQLMDEVRAGREELQQLTAKVAHMSVSSAQPRSPTPERRQTRVSFQVPEAQMQRFCGPPPYVQGRRSFRVQPSAYNSSGNRQFSQPGSGMQFSPCGHCGRTHGMNRCPAINATCFSCGRMGHLRAKCRSARRGAMGISE